MSATFKVQGLDVIGAYATNFAASDMASIIAQSVAMGANSIELTPLLFTASPTSNTVSTSSRSATDAALIAGIKGAEAAGLSVVLKPAIAGLDGSNSTALAPTDPAAFFASYQTQLVHLAAIAQATGVTTFSIGNEMCGLTGSQNLPYWTNLIKAVRNVYSGSLTYAAATTEASSVSFWSQVGTIGVNMYPPLSTTASPTVANLVQAWNSVPTDTYWAAALNYQSPVDFLHSLSTQYGKPALITEAGYRSITGTTIRPGDNLSVGISDMQAQANAYQAMAQVWSSETGAWFQGIEAFQGHVTDESPSNSYSPLGKPAQTILTQLFNGRLPSAGLTIQGSTLAQTLDYANSLANNVIIGGLANQTIIGGSGNDTIFAGPSTLAPLKTTTVTVTGYGDVVSGIGAQMQLLVNGTAVGNAVTFTAAKDVSGYQTYTFTFANTVPVTSLDVALLNPGSGRGLHLTGIDVNGVALQPAQAMNKSVPGTFLVYGGTPIHFDTTSNQAMFVGSGSADDVVVAGSGNDTVYGGAGKVTMVAGAGNDTFVGGSGASTVVFAGKSSDYTITWTGSTATVKDSVAGRDGTDTLTNITSIKFSDTALDLASLAHPPTKAGAATTASPLTYAWTATKGNTPYASQVTAFDTTGRIVASSRYYADGSLYSSTTINASGASTTQNYTQAGIPTQLVTIGADGSVDVKLFNGAGGVATDTLTHANGSRDRFDYAVTGQAYASDHLVFNAAGTLIDTIQYNADGSTYAETKLLANGAVEQDQYTAGKLAQSLITAATSVETKLYTNGALSSDKIRNADGTATLATYGITGQPYTSTMMSFSSAGVAADVKKILANGQLYAETKVLANGSTQMDQYTAGKLTQTIVTATDGSSDTKSFVNGALTTDQVRNADKSSVLYTYGVTGKPYTSSELRYNAAGVATKLIDYNTDGSRYLDQTTASDGSVTSNLYAGGRVIQQSAKRADGTSQIASNASGLALDASGLATGARALAFYDASGRQTVSEVIASDGSMSITGLAHQVTLAGGAGNDTLSSFGGDTLAFTGQSGHDTIARFYGGTGLYSDVISIKAAGVGDMQHLSLTQTGADVRVGINAQSDILIKNTALSQLSAHNFAFA